MDTSSIDCCILIVMIVMTESHLGLFGHPTAQSMDSADPGWQPLLEVAHQKKPKHLKQQFQGQSVVEAECNDVHCGFALKC